MRWASRRKLEPHGLFIRMPSDSTGTPLALPDSEQIRQTAQEVLSRPYYRLDEEPFDAVSFWMRIAEFFADVFGPIYRWMDGLFDISPILGWSVIGLLVALLLALVVHIIFTFSQAMRAGRRDYALSEAKSRASSDPKYWEELSLAAAKEQDFIRAVRFLFRACLMRLEQAQGRALPRGGTNREYLRRYQNTPAHEPLGRFVAIIDTRWYGGGGCTEEDLRECQSAHSTLNLIAKELADAQRA